MQEKQAFPVSLLKGPMKIVFPSEKHLTSIIGVLTFQDSNISKFRQNSLLEELPNHFTVLDFFNVLIMNFLEICLRTILY